jgi:uracil-DNA glycosylase
MDREVPYFESADAYIPTGADLDEVAAAAKGCRACHLWRYGTQTVFGEGARNAQVMLVGEQPGDREDLAGHPFVGPAGKLLTAALEEAGLDPSVTYTTNAVKHFKWEAHGTRSTVHRPQGADDVGPRVSGAPSGRSPDLGPEVGGASHP